MIDFRPQSPASKAGQMQITVNFVIQLSSTFVLASANIRPFHSIGIASKCFDLRYESVAMNQKVKQCAESALYFAISQLVTSTTST